MLSFLTFKTHFVLCFRPKIPKMQFTFNTSIYIQEWNPSTHYCIAVCLPGCSTALNGKNNLQWKKTVKLCIHIFLNMLVLLNYNTTNAVKLHGFKNNPQSIKEILNLVPLQNNSSKGVWARSFGIKATGIQRRLLYSVLQRVKHICNVWMSCHRAALQGRWLCRGVKRDHKAITCRQVDVRVDEEQRRR